MLKRGGGDAEILIPRWFLRTQPAAGRCMTQQYARNCHLEKTHLSKALSGRFGKESRDIQQGLDVFFKS